MPYKKPVHCDKSQAFKMGPYTIKRKVVNVMTRMNHDQYALVQLSPTVRNHLRRVIRQFTDEAGFEKAIEEANELNLKNDEIIFVFREHDTFMLLVLEVVKAHFEIRRMLAKQEGDLETATTE